MYEELIKANLELSNALEEAAKDVIFFADDDNISYAIDKSQRFIDIVGRYRKIPLKPGR